MTRSSLPDFADEVVTQSLVRYVDLANGIGTAALITLDNGLGHNRPNTFGPRSLHLLAEALDDIEQRQDLVAVFLTGKPFMFSVGADLKVFRQLRSRDDVREIGKLGHQVFRRLGELSVPSFSFINGAAMGGGLEVALHCTYRTASTAASALALPEVFLGLIPGWGGAYLLPRLIGPERAATVILDNPLNSNRMLKPKDALQLGVVDVVLESADFLEESIRWASSVVTGKLQVLRTAAHDETADSAKWDAALSAARARCDERTHGVPPAPYRALDLLAAARTSDRDAAFVAEDEALADMTMSPELAASLYAFDLVNKRAKRPVGAPDLALAHPVTMVGIVGAGLMASQLALLFARRLRVPVHLVDLDHERVDMGLTGINEDIDALAAKRRISPDEANRLRATVTGGVDTSKFADADFVIEAVFEDLAVKQQVLKDLEDVVSAKCVLATNTSSLSVNQLSDGLRHPERVVGFHFFNPVAVMPLIEVVRAPSTNEPSVDTAFALAKQLKKSAVLVDDAPGFVVNRLLTRFLGEVLAAVDEGTPIDVADRSLAPLGLPMTPFTLLQLVGPAVALHVAETMNTAFPDRFAVSANLSRMVSAGKYGVYTYRNGEPVVDPEITAMFTVGDSPLTAEQVLQRVLTSLADEIHHLLDDHVVEAPQDVDLCMLLGAGWPFWLGGITPYLDREGVSQQTAGGTFHSGPLDATLGRTSPVM